MSIELVAFVISSVVSLGTIAIAYFALRQTSKKDNIILQQNAQALLDTASKQTVEVLQVQIDSLKSQVNDLKKDVEKCHEQRDIYREERDDLTRRLLDIKPPARRKIT